MIGETVGSYRIVARISVGGMGTVWRGEHTLIGKTAAIKVLNPELSTNPDVVNRFFNEARATTAIKHPGIVEVYDFGYMPSGHAFLAMEFLEGCSLAHRLRQVQRMDEGSAAMLLRSVCNALAAAHAKGIVHRDLKPDNIYMTVDPEAATGERPKLLDFGIAKLTDIGLAGTATKTGAVMGTPTYMSPEQCRGTGVVDHRADLYSLGCIFYELVTGRPPFTNLGAGELIGSHILVAPEPPSKYRPDLSPHTVQLVMALLEKDPDRRPQTAKELAQRFGALAQQFGMRPSLPAVGGELDSSFVSPVHADPMTTDPTLLAAPAAATANRVAMTEPTTLSGAASQISTPKQSKRALVVALGAAAIAGLVGVVLLTSAGDPSTPSPQPAAAPAPAQPEPKAAPTPANAEVLEPPAAAPTAAAPTAAAPPAIAPAQAAPPVVPAKAGQPANAPPVEREPGETTAAGDDARPVEQASSKPTTKPVAKPRPKPGKKKPTLIETDL